MSHFQVLHFQVRTDLSKIILHWLYPFLQHFSEGLGKIEMAWN